MHSWRASMLNHHTSFHRTGIKPNLCYSIRKPQTKRFFSNADIFNAYNGCNVLRHNVVKKYKTVTRQHSSYLVAIFRKLNHIRQSNFSIKIYKNRSIIVHFVVMATRHYLSDIKISGYLVKALWSIL